MQVGVALCRVHLLIKQPCFLHQKKQTIGVPTAPKEHIYKSLRFVHSPMSLFIFKQVYKKFTMLVYSSSSTMNLQAKIGVYKAVNSCK